MTNNPMTVQDFLNGLENGPFTSLGGYPVYLVMADGECLSFDAAKSEAALIIAAITENDTTGGWLPLGFDINWEDTDLVCAHTGNPIPSAYGDE